MVEDGEHLFDGIALRVDQLLRQGQVHQHKHLDAEIRNLLAFGVDRLDQLGIDTAAGLDAVVVLFNLYPHLSGIRKRIRAYIAYYARPDRECLVVRRELHLLGYHLVLLQRVGLTAERTSRVEKPGRVVDTEMRKHIRLAGRHRQGGKGCKQTGSDAHLLHHTYSFLNGRIVVLTIQFH